MTTAQLIARNLKFMFAVIAAVTVGTLASDIPTGDAAATLSTPVQKITLAEALQRDLGMTVEEFWGENFVPEPDYRDVTASFASTLNSGWDTYTSGVPMRVSSPAGGGACTAGFRIMLGAESALMTAKHCLPPVSNENQPHPTMEIQPSEKVRSVLWSTKESFPLPNVDGAVIPFEFESNAQMSNRFYSDHKGPTPTGVRSSYGELTRLALPVAGEAVCSYGMTSGFRCGRVRPGTQPGSAFFDTDYCSRPGDSGGPVFTGNGILGVTSVMYYTEGTDRMVCPNGRRNSRVSGSGTVSAYAIITHMMQQGYSVTLPTGVASEGSAPGRAVQKPMK